MASIVTDLPLFELFVQLREKRSLGIEEYELLLVALQSGYGLSDRAALRQLCKTLWVKSHDGEDARLFDSLFDEMMSPRTGDPEPPPTEPPGSVKKPATGGQPPNDLSRKEEVKARGETSTKDPKPPPSPEDKENEDPDFIENLIRPIPEPSLLEIPIYDDKQESSKDKRSSNNRFIMGRERYPITPREMEQKWGDLRRHYSGLIRLPVTTITSTTKLDIEATVKKIARTRGIFVEPVLPPRRVSLVKLLLLIDQGGSMVPFHTLSRLLKDVASPSDGKDWVSVYYFHNCPVEVLYHDSYHVEAKPIKEVLQQLDPEQTVALIFSDAGAARRSYRRARLDLTKNFIEELKKHVRHIAWLNPVPRHRWPRTTAGRIERFVDMFSIGYQGQEFHEALDYLRGQPRRYTR